MLGRAAPALFAAALAVRPRRIRINDAVLFPGQGDGVRRHLALRQDGLIFCGGLDGGVGCAGCRGGGYGRNCLYAHGPSTSSRYQARIRFMYFFLVRPFLVWW